MTFIAGLGQQRFDLRFEIDFMVERRQGTRLRRSKQIDVRKLRNDQRHAKQARSVHNRVHTR
jgi:hypothetical protein